MSEDKTIVNSEPSEENRQTYLLQSISNRIAKLSLSVVRLNERLDAIEEDRDKYREERVKKEESTLDIIKKEIQTAAEKKELSFWTWIKDKALYIGITLLVVWLSQFVK